MRRRSSPLHSSPPKTADALVARINDYGESSAVAVLLTPDHGTIHAVAKGARRIANGYRGPLDKCVLYRVRLDRRGGEGLYLLNSSQVVESYPGLRRTPGRFHSAALTLEVATDLMRENEPQPELFRLTVFTLKVLNHAPQERLSLAVTLFLSRAVALSGHVPEIGCCVACGEPVTDERPLIGPQRGGVLHPGCAQGEPGVRGVSLELLEMLQALWDRPPGEILAAAWPAEGLRDLRRLLVEWLQFVLERRFSAAGPLERELAASVRIGP